MERTMTATEARQHFGELLRTVTDGGTTVIVEHRGQPAVAFVSVAAYERLTGAPLPARRPRLRFDEVFGGDDASPEDRERRGDRG